MACNCNKDHSAIQSIMAELPIDQGGKGRHKCAACAYEIGFQMGRKMEENIDLSSIFSGLDNSQAANQRHRSPHAAFAKGYEDGVTEYYKNK